MAAVDILIPTYNRASSLIMTLSGVASQTFTDFRVIVADQSDKAAKEAEAQVLETLQRVIEAHGGSFELHHRAPKHGIAEQRDFLLKQADAECVLYLDDDILMEPWVVGRLRDILLAEGCGFVGAFPNGLSYRDDVRPHQQRVEFWEGPVQPEFVLPGSPEWGRASLHAAANLYHASQKLSPGEVRRYKVAWVGACCLYDRKKLEGVGGFSFWSRLPPCHAGEEVLVQNLLLQHWGGCAIMPSGTYHAEVPTTIPDEARTPEAQALKFLTQMTEWYRLG
jgi:glycosyltransferase involved in cell wall biosynthesis